MSPFVGKDWRNATTHEGGGDTTTPISAAALEDMETRLSDYTDSEFAAFRAVAPINVRDAPYNAVPGGPDCTAAIQAAINAAPNGTVYMPPGTYRITDSLVIPDGLHLFGSSRWGTAIQMDASNKPILVSQENDSLNVVIEHLQLYYVTQQTYASHPNSYAIGWQAPDAADGSIYYWTLRNLQIIKATVGVGVMETGTTRTWLSVWNCHFENLFFQSVSHTMMHLGERGQPVNTFNMISHLNAQGSTVVKTGPAMRLMGMFVINGLDIEDWTNQLIDADGGSSSAALLPGVINGLHIERHTITQGSALTCIALTNGKFVVSGVHYYGPPRDDVTNFTHKLLVTDTADLFVNDVTVVAWDTVGGLQLLDGGATDTHVVMGVNGGQDTGVSVGGVAYSFQIEDNELKFGTDTSLYRSAANTLAVTDNFRVVGTDFRVAPGTSNQVYIGESAVSGGPGMQLGSSGDVAIGRAAAKLLALGSDHQLRVGTIAAASAPNDSLFVDSGNGKLSYKDSGGATNALY